MGLTDITEKIVKVDDYTVKFVLNRPEAAFLADRTMEFTSIPSKEYANRLIKNGTPELLNEQPVGTGPFQFVTYKKNADGPL